MTTAQQTFREISGAWTPPPKLTVSRWADTNRKLSREASAQAGDWKTRCYQREPMDCFTDPAVHTIVLMVAIQTLKTECLLNCIGYLIDRDPGPALVMQFRDKDCKKFSKIRLAPMLRDTPCLKGKVADVKSRTSGNTFEFKAFTGGHLSLIASGSPGSRGGLSFRYLFADEIDKYPASAGSSGDPIALAQGGQQEFWNRKTVLACSPTDKNSRISAAYEKSDKRVWELRCPVCGHYQIPNFKTQVYWDSNLPRHLQAGSARYHCANPDCDAKWDDFQRWKASRQGRFRATAPFNGVAGFWVSGLCRLGTKLHELVDEFLAKKENPEALKQFVNEQLAELWTEPGEILEWERLVERREAYAVATVPKGGLFLTAGVDVQREDGGRLEVEIVAWGENRESWSVDYRIFHGNPAQPEVWGKLEALLHETFPHESGGELAIERMFVDSGDGTTTREVYEWVSKQPRQLVWAIKGDRRGDQPVSGPRSVESNHQGKRTKYGTIFKLVNVDYFKSGFYADLRKRRPTDEELGQGLAYPQGFCHFPKDTTYGDEHFRQICAEQLVTRRDRKGRSKTEYQQLRPRNEALDCRIYAMAAAWDFGAHKFQQKHWDMLRLELERTREAPPEPSAPVYIAPASRPNWLTGNRTKPWLSR